MEEDAGGRQHNHFMQDGSSNAFTPASASGFEGLFCTSSLAERTPTLSCVTSSQGGQYSIASSLQQVPGNSNSTASNNTTGLDENQTEVEVLHDFTLQAVSTSSCNEALRASAMSLITTMSSNSAGFNKLPEGMAGHTADSGPVQDAGYCIVCATVRNNLALHMQAHSKEEMISALMGSSTPASQTVSSTSFLPLSSLMSPSLSTVSVTSRLADGKVAMPIMSTLPMTSPAVRAVPMVGCGPSGLAPQQQANSILGLGTAVCQAAGTGPIHPPKKFTTNNGILLSNVRTTPFHQQQQQFISRNNFFMPSHPPPSYQPITSNTTSAQYVSNSDMNVMNSGTTFSSVSSSPTRHTTASLKSQGNQTFLSPSIFGGTPNQISNQSLASIIGNQSFLIPPNANLAQTQHPVLNYAICSQSGNATVVGQPIGNSGSNIPNVNSLPYTHQVPLLLMPNCAMPLIQQQQSPKIEIKTDECGADGAASSSNNEQFMQPANNLQQIRHTQQIQYLQPQAQQIRMFQQQQRFSQQPQMLPQQQTQLFSQHQQLFTQQQQQQIQAQQAVVSQPSLAGAKLLLLGSNSAVVSPLNATNRGFLLTNNRLQASARPPLVSSCTGIANNMLSQNINNRTLAYITNKNITNNNHIQGATAGGVANISSIPATQQMSFPNIGNENNTKKTFLLPKPPSYQTAVKNSLLVNNLLINARTSSNSTLLRGFNSSSETSNECVGVLEHVPPPTSLSLGDRGSTLRAQKSGLSNVMCLSNASKADDSDKVTTVQVGNNITIAVPKDMANKRERLQQIINEELVRGILINDCNDPVRDVQVSKQSQEQGCSTTDAYTSQAGTNSSVPSGNFAGSSSQSSSQFEEMKVELFEELCGNESVDHSHGNQRVQRQGPEASVGKFSNGCTTDEAADANYNIIEEQEEEEEEEAFVEDGLKYSEDPQSSLEQHKSRLQQMVPLEDRDQSQENACFIVDRSEAMSEKIYVTEVGLFQPGPSRVHLAPYQTSLVNNVIVDPLSLQAHDILDHSSKPLQCSLSQSEPQHAREVKNSVLTTGESSSACSKRSLRSCHGSGGGRQSGFATTFTDLIKKDFTNDGTLEVASRRRAPSETTFSSGSSSFKVVGINELDQEKEQTYLPLEVKVKQDEICVVEDENLLFSPSSVVSSGTVASEHSSASEHSEHATSSRGSSSRRHDEDLSLRAAETLADSDSEHAIHDCHMDAPESLATSEVLLANLSEESNVSDNHQHTAMDVVAHGAPGTLSTSWLPVRQYSPKHYSRSRHSPTREDCQSPIDPQSPIDLRHSPRHGGRSANSAPVTSLPYPLHFHYHTQGVEFHSSANINDPSNTVSTVGNAGGSLQQQVVTSGQLQTDTGNNLHSVTLSGSSDSAAQHPSFGSPIVNSDGVVLNLDSCTVMPQTLNFAHLFSPPHSSVVTTSPDHPYHKSMASNTAGPSGSSCAPDEGGTNGIYLATSEIMRNISSYLGSPSSASKDNLQGTGAAGSQEEGFGGVVGYSQSVGGGSHVLGGLESSFSMANEFNMSFDDPVLASLAARRTPSRHESPRKAFPSPRLLGSPEPSTSGLSRAPPSLHEPDYEFDYDSDGYADSDNELHGRSSLPLEQWRCHVCNKMFKSLKEKLLHAGQHSPRCVVPGDVTASRFRSVMPNAKGDAGVTEMRAGGDTREVKSEELKMLVQVKGENVKADPDSAELLDRQESREDEEEDSEAIREAKSKEALKTIEACRTESQEFKCPECSSMFVNPDDLLVHRRRALQSKHICPFCHEEFENNFSKGHHMKSAHTEQQFSCPFCYVTYKSMYTWCRHQMYHLGIVLFECKCCGRRFSRKFEYEQHKRVHTGERPFSCPECEKCFANENNLRRHLLTHLEGQDLKCEVCSKVYKNTRTLSKHRASAHPSTSKKTKVMRDFICSIDNCGLIYASAKKLAWHQETHQRWPKRCEFCKERFIHTSNLVKHIRMKHNAQYMEEKEGNKSCPICFKVFLKSSLGQHMRIHSGVKPFKCYMCSKSFRVKCNLEAHMYVHSGKRDRPFKCTLCVRSFSRQKDLEAHIRSHKNIRPFTCNECGKSFIHKNNLSMHMAQHSGRKDYKCAQCGKAFFRKYNLQNHERVHTGQAPFTCPICLKTFTQKSNYNVHKKSFHVDRHTIHEEL